MKWIENRYVQLGILVILCLFLEYLCLGSIFYQPNQETFAYGGDALFLYFNTSYHACYGSGMMLESMNYPYGESVFMTDAQGALSIVLASLRAIGIDTCTYSIGIVNGMIIYLLPLCAVFIHLILRRIGVHALFSIVTSVAITLMAPQTLRMVSHYGLSYPFYIPMCIYWVLRKFDLQRWEWKDVAFIIVASFFYLNNPYVGFTGLLFIPIITLLKGMKSKAHRGFYAQFFSVVIGIILSGYAIIKLTDPFVDRIKEQNGFFFYNIDLHGVFNSRYGFTRAIVSQFYTLSESLVESVINYGIVPLIGVVILPFFLAYSIYSRKSLSSFIPSKNFIYIIVGSAILSLIACNSIMPLALQDFINAYFRPLLLFKAPGRFIWLSYFVIAIWTVWWLHSIIGGIRTKYVGVVLLTAIASLWIWEATSGLTKFVSEMHRSNNMFARVNEYQACLNEANVNPKDYQAIIALPIMQGWSSKLVTPLHWKSQYESTSMSMISGLPLIDGMLSRLSLDHGMGIVQLGSNPLIKKDLLEKMPDARPILVMDMSEAERLPGHQNYLLNRSIPLGEFKNFDLYRLEIDSLSSTPEIDRARSKYLLKQFKSPLHYDGFDGMNTSEDFRYQSGSLLIGEGVNQMMYSTKLESLQDSMDIEVSFWTLFTNIHESTPKFNFETIDSNGIVIDNIFIDSQYSIDLKNDWVKVSATLNTSENLDELRLYSTSLKSEIIDDLMIRYQEEDAVVDNQLLDQFLWNNYLIQR